MLGSICVNFYIIVSGLPLTLLVPLVFIAEILENIPGKNLLLYQPQGILNKFQFSQNRIKNTC